MRVELNALGTIFSNISTLARLVAQPASRFLRPACPGLTERDTAASIWSLKRSVPTASPLFSESRISVAAAVKGARVDILKHIDTLARLVQWVAR